MFERDAYSEQLARGRTMLSWWLYEHVPRFRERKFDQPLASPAVEAVGSIRSNAAFNPPFVPMPTMGPAPLYAPSVPPAVQAQVWPVPPMFVREPAFDGLRCGDGGRAGTRTARPTRHSAPFSGQSAMAAASRQLTGLIEWFKSLMTGLAKIFLRTVYAMLTLAACGAGLAYANYRYWQDTQPAERLLSQLAARVRPAVLSPTGELMGVIPPVPGAVFGLSDVGVDLHDLPEDFGRLLIRLEDAHSGKWWRGHIYGVDYISIPARIVGGVLKKGKPAGASTLWMQAASRANDGKRNYGVIERKLREYAGAAEIYNAYGGDVRRVALAYANAAPFARGMGGDVIGLVAAADIIFGVKANDLTRAQSAILASALNLPLILGDESAKAKAVFAYIKRRAIDALRAEFGITEAATAIAEINALGVLPPTRPMLENLPVAATGTIAGRTRVLVDPLLPAIRADLNTNLEKETANVVAAR